MNNLGMHEKYLIISLAARCGAVESLIIMHIRAQILTEAQLTCWPSSTSISSATLRDTLMAATLREKHTCQLFDYRLVGGRHIVSTPSGLRAGDSLHLSI